MLTVVSYLNGVPSPLKNPHKVEVLKKFTEGVKRAGDNGISHLGNNLISCDVGVIQGWVHADSPNTPHLLLRKNVADNKKNRHTVIVDSNLFNYEVGKLYHHLYARFSLDGVFPTTGNYFSDIVDPNRWKKISKDLNLSLKDWRTNGNHILLACQRNGGWSMGGYDVVDWITSTVNEIRKYSDRPIVIRAHPGDKNAKRYLTKLKSNCIISTNEKIKQDFKNAWATITYNSSPGVASAIEGIPVFVTDPNPKVSQAAEVANIDISQIENPKYFERQNWIEKLSMCHWKYEEVGSGVAWDHMRKFLS